jgi:exodeoxyribonuclease VII small subunit
MARRKTNPEDDSAAPSFEDALAGLESIVDAMEHQQLPLEELVAYYEKGSALLDRCESVLQSARGRIELITLRNQNESPAASGSGAGDSTAFPTLSAQPDASDDDDDDDDIRLF